MGGTYLRVGGGGVGKIEDLWYIHDKKQELIGHFRVTVPQASVSKRGYVRSLDQYFFFFSHANETYFHDKDFALSLV